ncbi:caspase domain-containing protein [Aspergillus nidulans var. acristatus]
MPPADAQAITPPILSQVYMKRALIIATPFGELRGPENDAASVTQFLERDGFEIQRCCGRQATESAILETWLKFISQVQQDDIVFIYYSGHGGIVQYTDHEHQQRRHQFIVPMDYDCNEGQFNGILDVEIAALLQKLTDKTKNVTAVFDCCHSGRIARNPLYRQHAISKSVPSRSQQALRNRVERQKLNLSDIRSLEGNPDVVRVVACADLETAWEYKDDQSEARGVFTEALVSVMENARDTGLTWRNVMTRVSELVASQFPDQHPHVEGPHQRIILSLEQRNFEGIPVRVEGDKVTLQAGRLAGVREKNEYMIMPLECPEAAEDQMIGTASVIGITTFDSILKFDAWEIPATGALAYLTKEYPYPYPIVLSEDLRDFSSLLTNGSLIRPADNDQQKAFAYIYNERDTIIVTDASHSVCASFGFNQNNKADVVKGAIQQVEFLSRAWHLLNLKAEGAELLRHDLQFTLRTVLGQEELPLDGTANVSDNDRVLITLQNQGAQVIFVSVFNVTVSGKISLVSNASPRGIELQPKQQYVLGRRQHVRIDEGLKMSWPRTLPGEAQGPVSEYFVYIVSAEAVDLRYLEEQGRNRVPRGNASQLEKLVYQLSYGTGRDCAGEGTPVLQWDLVAVPFLLYQGSSQQ